MLLWKWFPLELIDAVTCCTQYSRVSEPGNKNNTTQWNDTGNISNKPRVRTEVDASYEKMLDPVAGSPATGKSVVGIIDLFVDDLFGTGGTEKGTTSPSQTKKGFPSWFKLERRTLNQERPLRLANKWTLRNWRRSQWNDTRKMMSIVHVQCIQGTEAFWDR